MTVDAHAQPFGGGTRLGATWPPAKYQPDDIRLWRLERSCNTIQLVRDSVCALPSHGLGSRRGSSRLGLVSGIGGVATSDVVLKLGGSSEGSSMSMVATDSSDSSGQSLEPPKPKPHHCEAMRWGSL